MKLYSTNTGKFVFAFGIAMFCMMLCFCLCFAVTGQTRRAWADDADTSYVRSLDGYTADGSSLASVAGVYQINSVDDLRAVAYLVNNNIDGGSYARASYRLNDYLDLSEYAFWEPIGTAEYPFEGNFDGAGYSIFGLTIIDQSFLDTTAALSIDDTADSYAGLFGYVKYDSAAVVIKNLGLKDALIKTSRTYAGGLIGLAEGDASVGNAQVTVSQCYVTGYIEGSDYVGGLIGSMEQCARVEDSYFLGSARTEARYLGTVPNSQYDIATNIEGGCVGGIAGSAVDNSVDRIIENCYNAGVVGKTGDFEIIRGALVGYKNDLKTNNLKRNFYLKTVLPGATSTELKGEGGSSTNLGNIKGSFLDGMFFDYDAADVDGYLPALPTSTWQWSAKVNNGLPFLLNTPQLVRVEFVTKLVGDASEINSTDIANVMDSTTYRFKSGDSYFVDIISDSTVTFSTSITAGSDADFTYTFDSWTTGALATSTNSESSSLPIGASLSQTSTGIADMDKVFVAKYTMREYSITLGANDLSRAASLVVREGESVLTSADRVHFGAEIYIEAIPAAGYQLASFATPATSLDFVASVSGQPYTAALDLDAYIRAIGQTVSSDNINTLSVVANFEPESYTIFTQASRDDCLAAAVIKDNQGTVMLDGAAIHYGDTIYLTIDSVGIAPNFRFSGWRYQVVDADASPSPEDWIDITSSGEREDSIDFVVPDVIDTQVFYFLATFQKVTHTVSIDTFNTEAGSIVLVDYLGTPLGYNTFAFDEAVYVKITANTGYYFDTVSIDGVQYRVGESALLGYPSASWDADNSRIVFAQLASNVAVTVDFLPVQYSVTVSLQTSDVVSANTQVVDTSTSVSVLAKTNKVLYNHDFAFSVLLEPGFDLVGVSVAGEDLTASTELVNGAAFVYKIRDNTQIIVTVSKQTFDVNARFGYAAEYDYTVDPSCITGTGEYFYHTPVAVRVALPDMFTISSWTINGVLYPNTTGAWQISSIDADLDIVIHLVLKTSQVSFGQIGDSASNDWFNVYWRGTSYHYMTNLNSLVVNYGDLVQFYVADQYYVAKGRSSMYTFAYWQVNGVSMTTDRAFALTAVNTNYLVEAVFKPALVQISIDTFDLDPFTAELTQSDLAGKYTGLSSSICNYGQTISVVATAFEGYRFVEWRDKYNNLLTSNRVYTFTVDQPAELKAVFVSEHNVAVIIEENEGSVVGGGKTVVGDVVVLRATARSGYRFVSWLQDGVPVCTTSEFRFTMPATDVLLTVEFEKVYAISYHTNDDALGQVLGNTSGKFKENVTLEAVSANNCSFVGWMIDNVMVSTSPKLNISLNGDVEVEALFKKNFDWNIIIIILGCGIFALVMVCGVVAYIRSKEAQPITTRSLIGGKDDSDILKKTSERNALRDEIAPVPTRKRQRVNVQPVPVRKIVVEPTDHKGNKPKSPQNAKQHKKTLKTDDDN